MIIKLTIFFIIIMNIVSSLRIPQGINKQIFTRSYSTTPNKFDGYERSLPKSQAYTMASTSNITMPIIILVNPFLDQNVGSVSRAMLNFGLHELRVVDPVCNITSDNATSLSAGSYEVLQNAKIYPTLQEAVADLNRVFATTVRLRHLNQLIYTPRAAAEVIVNTDQGTENRLKYGIVFGRERNGLTNEEVNLADSIITIPTFNYFTSINLAQAVNIVSYEMWCRKIYVEETAPPDVWWQGKRQDRLARKEELDHFLNRLQRRLDEREYQGLDMTRRELNYQGIRSVFQRSMLSNTDVDMLHGVLTTLTDPKNKNLVIKPIPDDDSNPPLSSEEK